MRYFVRYCLLNVIWLSYHVVLGIWYLLDQVEALKEQLWELDTANRNNLVFYGVREEGFSPEAAIRDVIKRFGWYHMANSFSVQFIQKTCNIEGHKHAEGEEGPGVGGEGDQAHHRLLWEISGKEIGVNSACCNNLYATWLCQAFWSFYWIIYHCHPNKAVCQHVSKNLFFMKSFIFQSTVYYNSNPCLIVYVPTPLFSVHGHPVSHKGPKTL